MKQIFLSNFSQSSKLIGFDALAELANSGVIRNANSSDGMLYYGLADFLTHFAPEDRDLSQWWKKEKKRLVKRDPELGQILTQLKMVAADGKMYRTESAPLWACFYIVLMIDTPKANDFKKQLAKGLAMTVEQVIYRARNISQGAEWAADTNHAIMHSIGEFNDPDLQQPDTWNDITGKSR